MWLIFAFGSAVFAAAVAILGKLGLQNIDSTLATTLRSVVMAIFLLIIALFLGKFSDFSFHSLGTKEWFLIFFAGIAGALSWLCYFFALQNGNATAVVAIDKLSVVFVVILSIIFLSQEFTWKLGLGALLMTAGAILISLK